MMSGQHKAPGHQHSTHYTDLFPHKYSAIQTRKISRDGIAQILQTIFSNAFSWETFVFSFKFHCTFLPGSVGHQCCRNCKILPRLTGHLWLMFGWSVSFLGSPPINNLPRPWNQSKNGQNGPNRVNGHLISVHLWNCLSTSIPKHFLQNLKNPLVAKRTIYGRTLGRPVDSWVAFGDHISAALGHMSLAAIDRDYSPVALC